ncbi:hypothetical protein ACFQLX_20480 [Streptomyces polyrhachis]|uniref:Uncharacterized protein n=1 Tax=Streptomyces polyrhachis TaxID=1282885 RepID=A0ABW2GLJ1_9ACTN
MPVPALPRFLYLDEKSLSNYLSVVEGGISDQSTTRRSQTEERRGVGPDLSEERSVNEEREMIVRETPSHQFTRLIRALDADPERWNYVDVADLSASFDSLSVGQLISVTVEIEVPPTIQLLSQPEQLSQMLDMLGAFRSIAPVMGHSADDLPGQEEVRAMRDMTGVIQSDVVIVGDQEEDGPKVAGKLSKDYVGETLEGEVCVVGKIARRWRVGESHYLLALPGASLMNRSQRRRAESEPTSNSDETTLRGPAFTMDILAIYR